MAAPEYMAAVTVLAVLRHLPKYVAHRPSLPRHRFLLIKFIRTRCAHDSQPVPALGLQCQNQVIITDTLLC